MTPYQKRVTAFTKRMAEDMQLRNLSPRTIDAYTYHVDRFAMRFGKHPEELGPEQVRDFQLWMINELHSSWSQFRDLFLSRLKQLVEKGKLQIQESGYIADLIGELQLMNWVAFIEGPPKPDTPPIVMLKYLTRYLTGGPISNRRIVGERDGRIYFMARSKRKGEGQVEASLSKVEFVQQWCLHILPKKFTKTRFYGTWSGSKRKAYIEQCRQLAPSNNSVAEKPSQKPSPSQASCPHCQGSMQCVVQEQRPKWRDLFYGPAHPSWFEWTSRGKCVPSDPLIESRSKIEEPIDIELDIFDQIIASRKE